MSEKGRVIGGVQEYGPVTNLDVGEVRRFGIVSARRYRIETADGTERNFEAAATKSVESFFAQLRPRTPAAE